MTRLALSVVLGLGVLSGVRSQTASAAFPVTAANCGPGYSTNYYSAWNSPYSRSTSNYWSSYDRSGGKYGSPYSRYSSWDNNYRYDNYRYTDYSRLNRVRDAYLDRWDDYKYDHRYHNHY